MNVETINDRIEKAQNGDAEQMKLCAKAFYYGENVERSLALARYWAFKAIQAGCQSADEIYKLVNGPHLTGNEQYLSLGGGDDITLIDNLIFSTSISGTNDPLYSNNYKRAYLVHRFLLFFIPRRAYRVNVLINGSIKIIGQEKMHISELLHYILIDIIFIIVLITYIISNF